MLWHLQNYFVGSFRKDGVIKNICKDATAFTEVTNLWSYRVLIVWFGFNEKTFNFLLT
jgi:hypothetical protein